MSKIMVVVSDLHCGSTVGLLPPDFVTKEGNPIGQNKAQKFLWERWVKFIDTVLEHADGDSFDLVVNGDCTEGVHHHTTEVVSPDIEDHLSCAIHSLNPLAEYAERMFVVEGTECHTKGLENAVSVELGGERNRETGRNVFDKLRLKMNGILHHFHHHMTCTKRKWLEASALGLELRNEQLNFIEACSKNGDEIPNVLGMAHRHVGGAFSDGSYMSFCTPPWQLRTRYAKKVVPTSLTQVGGIILDYRQRYEGELPDCRLVKYEPFLKKSFIVQENN